MTALLTPSSNLWYPSTINRILCKNQGSGTSLSATYTPSVGGSGGLLLGVDMTATQANPVQCFASLQLGTGGPIFYWDSQSTGEGNGITFGWRGQLKIDVSVELICTLTAASTITLGIVAWGLVGQLQTLVQDV